ncbi:MAG TPA: GNAT family N-acetyltransferase [Acidimicrobiales bacterium]
MAIRTDLIDGDRARSTLTPGHPVLELLGPGVSLAVARSNGADPTYAIAVPTAAGWSVELSAPPAGPDRAELAASAVHRAVDAVTLGRPGVSVHCWVSDHGPEIEHAVRAGLSDIPLVRERHLLQLRVPLPLSSSVTRGVTDIAVDTLRPGTTDEEDWVAVNAAAFAWHPEEANRTIDDLHSRMAQPWFDGDGLLVHRDPSGSIDAFNWTVPRLDADPPMGEIYVIGVHPDAHGRGLGRALTVAGLRHLHRRHRLEVGMLWAESDNEPARRLYASLGFTEHHRRTALVLGER